MPPLDLVTQGASIHAATGALLALRVRRATGRGQHVDVSLQETAVLLNDMALTRYSMFGEAGRRGGSQPLWPACNIYPTRDGWVFLTPFTAEQARQLEVEWMQHPTLCEPAWRADSFRRQNMDAIDRWVTEFTHRFATQEFIEEAQRRGVPAAPLATIPQAITFLREAGAFVETSHLTVGPYPILEMPFRLHTTAAVIRRPAPLLGQHTEEIALGGWGAEKQPKGGELRASSIQPPLAGVRVLDFSRLLAGPLTTLTLAAFGAEVVKIESADLPRFDDPSYPDFHEANRSKLSLSLDVRQPKGRELAQRLARLSDVVVENFRPGVMERLGLGYDNLRQMKPSIIMASLPGIDPQAPQRDWGVYGQQMTALTGLTYLWGHPGSPLSTHPKIPVSDVVVAAEATLAVLAALEWKARTGEGHLIEVPQLVAMANLLAIPYLDYFLNEWETLPRGNGSPTMAPHGVYRCRGEDAWCAIAVTSEQEWRRFVEVLGSPEWALDGRFATVQSRLHLRDELDRHVEEWTLQRTPWEVMRLLQGAGVPAGAVLDGKGLAEDPHLRQRGFIMGVRHPGWGYIEHAGTPALLSETPGKADGPVHGLGQDNDYVLRGLLGLSAQDVEGLVRQEVVR
ncbi:MAG: CoA transferase [Chloroflexi bacterium]|nr:CoA transferase [Chloroflexota bacterium]